LRNEELYNLRLSEIELDAGLIYYIARTKRKRIPTVALLHPRYDRNSAVDEGSST